MCKKCHLSLDGKLLLLKFNLFCQAAAVESLHACDHNTVQWSELCNYKCDKTAITMKHQNLLMMDDTQVKFIQ